MTIRKLNNNDRDRIEAFLTLRSESSMFLLSNARRSGLEYEDRPFHADYYASFAEGNTIDGILAHCWNGNIIVQAPRAGALTKITHVLRREISRPIAGILGPSSQAAQTIDALGLQHAPYAINVDDGLFALDLENLISPTGLSDPDVSLVPASDCNRDLIGRWLKGYEIEALGKDNDAALDKSIASRIARLEEWKDLKVLEIAGQPVAMSGFSARLTEIVQIGPVWTPMEHRNRQYARTIVAATLQQAIAEGVKRAVLFANDPAAIRSYEAIGFERIDRYQISMLKQPVDLPPNL